MCLNFLTTRESTYKIIVDTLSYSLIIVSLTKQVSIHWKVVTMIRYSTVHQQGRYIVRFNHQVNAYNPYQVVNTETNKAEFSYCSLGVCLNYVNDNSK